MCRLVRCCFTSRILLSCLVQQRSYLIGSNFRKGQASEVWGTFLPPRFALALLGGGGPKGSRSPSSSFSSCPFPFLFLSGIFTAEGVELLVAAEVADPL